VPETRAEQADLTRPLPEGEVKIFGKLVVAIKVGRGPTGPGCFLGAVVHRR
jgi:hypothetical protein